MGIKWRKSYIEGSSIGLEEDTMIEFKNHKSISFEEVPPDKIGIQPVSNTICGFLNQGKGKVAILIFIIFGLLTIFLTES